MMANNLVNEKVAPGKKLKLPPATKPGPRVKITIESETLVPRPSPPDASRA
jgi:hypothetical protein